MKELCVGGCGRAGLYVMKNGNKWCSKHHVNCPVISKKRASNISRTKLKQAKLGLNPMQNPEICRKNHSPERNRKAAETLRKLGKLDLLPQQKKSSYLKEKRRRNVIKALKILSLNGELHFQKETKEQREARYKKISEAIKRLGQEKMLYVQNMTPDEKAKFSKKISKTLRDKFRNGLLRPYHSYGKRIIYNSKAGEIVLRSFWEKEVATFLDSINIGWRYEHLVVPYWNSTRKVRANTIPDFYLKDYNLIIEVKGNGEAKSRETMDKLKGLKRAGFNAMLFSQKQLNLIRNGRGNLLLDEIKHFKS